MKLNQHMLKIGKPKFSVFVMVANEQLKNLNFGHVIHVILNNFTVKFHHLITFKLEGIKTLICVVLGNILT